MLILCAGWGPLRATDEVNVGLNYLSEIERLMLEVKGERGIRYEVRTSTDLNPASLIDSTIYLSNGDSEVLFLDHMPNYLPVSYWVQLVKLPGRQVLDRENLHPFARYQPSPIYPPALRFAGISGHARMEFIVSSNGRTKDINPVTYSHIEFAQAAEVAIARWLFEPGHLDGEPVSYRVRINIPYQIRGDATVGEAGPAPFNLEIERLPLHF